VDDLYRFVPYLAALIAFAGSAYMFTRGPKEGCFDPVGPLVQTGVTMATLLLYVGLLKINISPVLWVPSLGVGVALGAYGSRATTLELRPDGSVRTVRTMWYLAVLAATIGISQVLIRQSLLHKPLFNGGLAALYFGTGTAVASNVTLLVRVMALKKTTLADILAPIGSFSWREGTEGSPWQKLRGRVATTGEGTLSQRPPGVRPAREQGAPTAAPPAAPAARGEGEIVCPKCGAVSAAGRKFCRICGERFSA
jgi:hypothetical protein